MTDLFLSSAERYHHLHRSDNVPNKVSRIRRSRCLVPGVMNLGTTGAISSENHAPAAFSPMEEPRYVLNKSVEGSQSLPTTPRQKREKNVLLPGIELKLLGCLAYGLAIVPSILTRH